MIELKTDEERLIWKLAETHWAHAMGEEEPPLSQAPLVAQELYFDAMHMALCQLAPTAGMVEAAFKPTPRERAAAAIGVWKQPYIRRSDKITMAQKFAAMMDWLLRIEGGCDAQGPKHH